MITRNAKSRDAMTSHLYYSLGAYPILLKISLFTKSFCLP